MAVHGFGSPPLAPSPPVSINCIKFSTLKVNAVLSYGYATKLGHFTPLCYYVVCKDDNELPLNHNFCILMCGSKAKNLLVTFAVMSPRKQWSILKANQINSDLLIHN